MITALIKKALPVASKKKYNAGEEHAEAVARAGVRPRIWPFCRPVLSAIRPVISFFVVVLSAVPLLGCPVIRPIMWSHHVFRFSCPIIWSRSVIIILSAVQLGSCVIRHAKY